MTRHQTSTSDMDILSLTQHPRRGGMVDKDPPTIDFSEHQKNIMINEIVQGKMSRNTL
jgi:hypothetical protein